MKQQYDFVTNTKKEYTALWQAYGGVGALKRSLYLWASLAVVLLINLLRSEVWLWYKDAIQILPNLIGFTLGGYAILLAFGDSKFIDAIRTKRDNEEFSPYLRVSASMAFFVICQVFCLLFALFFNACSIHSIILNLFLGWIFLYSLSLGLAATMGIFFLTKMYDKIPNPTQKHDFCVNDNQNNQKES